MKNIKTNVIETIDNCNEESVTFNRVIKEFIPMSIFIIILSTLMYKYIFMPIVEPIVGAVANSFLPVTTIISFLTCTAVQMTDSYKINKNKKIGKKDIIELQKELKSNGLNYTTKEILNADIWEMENKTDKVIKKGKKTQRKKVTNYIIIDSKTKMSIIKETITCYKKMREETTETILLENQDLKDEGITDKYGFLTEKGKALILKKD